MINQRLPKIWYGGDYNPEQWDKATMEEDLRMFELAGVDVATLNVFSWAKTRAMRTAMISRGLMKLWTAWQRSRFMSAWQQARGASGLDGQEIPGHPAC